MSSLALSVSKTRSAMMSAIGGNDNIFWRLSSPASDPERTSALPFLSHRLL